LQESVDFTRAKNQEAGSQLFHTINLIDKELPEWIVEIKKKYKI